MVWRAPAEELPPPDAAQRAILDAWDGPVLVVGGPGTGKTVMAAHAALEELCGGGTPLVFARTRAAASSLRNLITRGLAGAVWQPSVTTVHAFARSVFQRFAGGDGWRLLTAPEQEFRVRELLAGRVGRWPVSVRAAVTTAGFARQVRAGLARARQWGLDPADVVAAGEEAGDATWVALGGFFAEYLDVLDAEQVLDYAELVHRARIALAVPEVAGAVRRQVSAVVVDDYPELDPAQLGVVAALAPGGGRVLAVGDPHTVLSGFRGAHPRAVAGFTELFGGGRVVELGQGYRHGPVLAGALAGLSARMDAPVARGVALRMKAVPATRAGAVRAVACASEAAQAVAVAQEVRRARLDGGLGYDQMAVLVRSGQRSMGVILRALAKAGVPVQVAGSEVVLAQARPVRTLLTALEVAARGWVDAAEAAWLLTSPLAGLDALGLRWVERAHRALAESSAMPSDERLAAALNEPGWCGRAAGTPWEARVAPVARVAALLARARDGLVRGRSADEVAWGLWRGSGWPGQLDAQAVAGGASGARAGADLDALGAFFSFAGECGVRGGLAGVRMLAAEVEAQQIPADHEREARVGRGVEVMTVHRAKGRQWPLVVVAGATQGAWPTFRHTGGVIDPDELRADGLAGGFDARASLAAERRLFYAACATARDTLVVTCVSSADEDGGSPSRFIAELGVEPVAFEPSGEALALGPLVARLRRESASADVGEPRRRAAAAVLGELAGARDGRGRAVVPGADPASWWGVLPVSGSAVGGVGRDGGVVPGPAAGDEPDAPGSSLDRPPFTAGGVAGGADGGEASPVSATLSPSQLSTLLECPRRYFLRTSARADVPASGAAALGSIVHAVVQRAQADGASREELVALLDGLWEDQYPAEIGWVGRAQHDEAVRALDKFLAWQRSRLAEVVAVEEKFRFPVDIDGFGLVIVGALDRLEREPDERLRVVDFKTSKTPYSQAKTDGLEQLGVYQLAVDGGAFGEGECAGGTLVFLRAGNGDMPVVRDQDALSVRPHLGDDPEELAYPTWVHHRLAQAVAVIRDGSYPATPGAHCRGCSFAGSCPASPRGKQVVR